MPWFPFGADTVSLLRWARRFFNPFPPTSTIPACCRSEEHTSELQSLMRISYAVFCLKKKKSEHTIPHAQVYYDLFKIQHYEQRYNYSNSKTAILKTLAIDEI